jgi:hypothetical protein
MLRRGGRTTVSLLLLVPSRAARAAARARPGGIVSAPRLSPFLLIVLAHGAAEAQLPSGTFDESGSASCAMVETYEGYSETTPENLSVDNSLAGTLNCQAISSTSIYGYVRPLIDLRLHVSGTTAATASAQAFATYYARVNGPPGIVRFRVTAHISILGASASANGVYGLGRGQVDIPLGGSASICSWWEQESILCAGPEGGNSFDYDQLVDLTAGTTYSVGMQASASVQVLVTGGPTGLAEVQVVVDPTFEFDDPEDAATWTLEFSPNLFDGLFRDGFEHGYTTAWSTAEP